MPLAAPAPLALRSRDLARALAALDATLAGMTPAQLAWHPPEKWSAAQALEHLSITYSSTARLLEKVAQGPALPPLPSSLRGRAFAGIVTGLGYFPKGRKAPEFTLPRGLAPEEAVRSARAGIIAMDAPLAACVERFGAAAKLAKHPVLGPLNARQWARFHWVHTRHHLRQIERLKMMARTVET